MPLLSHSERPSRLSYADSVHPVHIIVKIYLFNNKMLISSGCSADVAPVKNEKIPPLSNPLVVHSLV